MKTFLAIFLVAAVVHGAPTPKPSATPDLSKVTQEEIVATIKHRDDLLTQQTGNIQKILDTVAMQQATLGQATAAVLVLQSQLTEQAKELTNAKVTIAEAHAACWRNLAVGFVAGMVVILVGPLILKLASKVMELGV